MELDIEKSAFVEEMFCGEFCGESWAHFQKIGMSMKEALDLYRSKDAALRAAGVETWSSRL